MRRMTMVWCVVAPVCVATGAMADDYPARKAGLWELSVTISGGKIPPRQEKMCIDSTTDAEFRKLAEGGGPEKRCSRFDMQRSGSTYTIDSVCTIGTRQVTTHSVNVYTGDSAYHVESQSRFDPPLTPGHADNTISQDGKWMGPCPPDMRPGDMVMGNGMKINMLDLPKQQK